MIARIPGSEPASARRSTRAFAPLATAAVALGVAACAGRSGPVPAPIDPAGGDGAPVGRAAVEGRLVTVAARGDGNEVAILDLASGASEVVWTTGPEIADWHVAPTGERAAYRAAIRFPRAAESLEVRELAAGASPRVVATVDPEVERIAGHAFAEDGAALLYASQAVEPSGAAALWLAGARPGDEKAPDGDRPYRSLPLDARVGPLPALSLVAWSSHSGRAILREDAPDGGPVLGASFFAEPVAGPQHRSPAPAADAALAAAPDAAAVAWLPRDGGPVVVDDGTGPREVAPGDGGWPALPLFDRTGTVLAWQVNPDGGGPAWVRVADVRGGGAEARTLRQDGESLQPLAFSPDGAWLLLGAGPPEALDPTRLLAADLATGTLAPLAWPPPEGLWGADWVPAP